MSEPYNPAWASSEWLSYRFPSNVSGSDSEKHDAGGQSCIGFDFSSATAAASQIGLSLLE